jgi:hypothetical protein
MAIRPDNDPRSSTPRSGAPKGELEQYGVWVKAEPQDIIEEIALPDSGDLDFNIPTEDVSSSGDIGPLPDIEDMPPLEESLLSPEPSPAIEEIEDFGASTIDIPLAESASDSSFASINPGVEIDMSSVEGLDSPSAPPKASSDAIEDVSSEFLDAVEEPASAFGSTMDDVTAEFLDIDDAATGPAISGGSTPDFEPLDIDLHFDDSVQDSSSGDGKKTPSSQDSGFEAVTEFDDFLADGSASSKAQAFDDVSAVERELSSPAPAAPASPKSDLSTEILLKIASELSSIRGELVSLKTQIGDVMVSVDAAPKKGVEDEEGAQSESETSGGFFDEEEDETIALTGDELDNILNTADFTTEDSSGDDSPAVLDIEETELQAESADEGLGLLDESLLPESGDYSSPEALSPAIEEIHFDEEADEGLSLVAEEGVTVLTPAPEDTSYLETPEDLGLEASLDEGSLADAPLVEPDLSEFDLGPEEVEPRLEIDEELPLASSDVSAEIAEEPVLEELTLDIDAGPDYQAKTRDDGASEAEFIEPVPEIEEPNFAEISLHEEKKGGEQTEAFEVEDIDMLSDDDFLASEPQAPAAVAMEEPSFAEEEEDLVLAAEEEPPLQPEPAPKAQASAPAAKSPPPPKARPAAAPSPASEQGDDGDRLKSEIKSVLSYLDKLLDSLPEEKIEEFAKSKYFDTYKKLFEELGLV